MLKKTSRRIKGVNQEVRITALQNVVDIVKKKKKKNELGCQRESRIKLSL